MKRKEIVGIPLYFFNSGERLAKEALDVVKTEIFIDNTSNTMTETTSLHKNEKLIELHRWFTECLQEVCREELLPYPELKVKLSWANCAGKGQHHQRHAHNNSVVSGIYYLTEGGFGETIFMENTNLWRRNLFHLPGDDLEFHNEAPEIGKLILFPSSLRHQVDPHQDDVPRYTIAFNSFPVGDIGDERLRNFLEIR